MAEIEILLNVDVLNQMVKGVVDSAIRLPSDMYGNPRWYIPCFVFNDRNGDMFRPAHANAYRGKKYGRGWAFQTYNLKRSVEIEYGLKEPIPD